MASKVSASQSKSDLPLQVRLARSAAEADAAMELAARVFGPSYFEAREHKAAVLRDIEPLSGPGAIVIALDAGAIVGLIRLVDRQLRFERDVFGVTGITSVAVDPAYRNRGVGGALMRVAMREGRKRGDDVSVLFARRAVDGWYPKFSFLGVGQHVQLTVATNAAGEERRAGRWAAGMRGNVLPSLAPLYEASYRALPGNFVRPADWWQRFEARLRLRPGAELLTLSARSRGVIAYAIVEGNRVIEAAVRSRDAASTASALLEEMRRRGVTEVIFALHPSHPLMAPLFDMNHTLSVRRAWDGGHMAAPLTRRAASRLRAADTRSIEAWPVWSPMDEF